VAGAQHTVSVSAFTRDGLDELRSALSESLSARHGNVDAGTPVLTRARHRAALERAERELQAFLAVWRSAAVPTAVAGVHIHAASESLEELIGAVDGEHVLERVFSTFCIGK
jgi:tRNA modification GTPase